MKNGQYNDLSFRGEEVDAIGEPAKQGTANRFTHYLEGTWVLGYELEALVGRFKDFNAEAGAL